MDRAIADVSLLRVVSSLKRLRLESSLSCEVTQGQPTEFDRRQKPDVERDSADPFPRGHQSQVLHSQHVARGQ